MVRTASGGSIRIDLLTDSEHLQEFFEGNWHRDDESAPVHGSICALRGSAADYGLDERLDFARWCLTPQSKVWMFGSEYYGNIKITVRGLCSEVAGPDDSFIHGCALCVDSHGVILSGVSGAGKTTVTSALRKLCNGTIRIVNDDWGGLSLTTGQVRFTGEASLHMKYPSVKSLAPHLDPCPETYLSENFLGDAYDPHARLLIRPEEVFGTHGLALEAHLACFVFLIRDTAAPPELRRLDERDIDVLERGRQSAFYDRSEFFMNGSLFLTSEDQWARHRQQMLELLGRYPCYLLNNSGTAEEAGHSIIGILQHTGDARD